MMALIYRHHIPVCHNLSVFVTQTQNILTPDSKKVAYKCWSDSGGTTKATSDANKPGLDDASVPTKSV